MKSPLSLIIAREYRERVRRKSFIVTTLLMPLFIIALMVLPSVIMALSGTERQTIAVVDESGLIAPSLTTDGSTRFVVIDDDTPLDSLKADGRYDAILAIGSDIVANPDDATLYTQGAPSLQTEMFITAQIESAVRMLRIMSYDIEGLEQIIADTQVSTHLSTFRLDKEGEEETSSGLSYIMGVLFAMMLYIFIMLYGQMVMNSIIEEKNNRVLELMVSSVRPKTLMLGKILGIGAVAATQIAIWGVLIVAASKWVVPALPFGADGDMVSAIGMLSDTGYITGLMACMLLFLVGGLLFYSSIYAAVGSAVDNAQDAAQLTFVATMPIIVAMMVGLAATSDPNSPLAVWASYIPFTAPVVMMARLPFGVDTWQVVLSLAVLAVSFAVMLWIAAKIYRVGIFMHGKKPTFKDLVRWVRES